MKNIYSEALIELDLQSETKEDAIKELASLLYQDGRVHDLDAYTQDVFVREQQFSTNLGNGVGMPHAISKAVRMPSVAIGISQKGIAYDEGVCHIILLIAMPSDCSLEHIKVLSDVNTVFIGEHNIHAIQQAKSKKEILRLFAKKEMLEADTAASKPNVFLIGCTGCASGVAHTYLAAKSLIKAAEERNAVIKVETNGSIGVENTPTSEEIERAACIILASDKSVDMERFHGKRILYANAKDGINKAEELIDRALRGEGIIYEHKSAMDRTHETKRGQLYNALMNGVSFMIPFVAIGGIMTALAHAFGATMIGEELVLLPNTIWANLAAIGSIAMTLMLPIFSGYIAYAISDRPALAPGMMGGWIAANGSFYNSEYGAGFLGAVLAGLLAGYVVKGIKKIKVSESFQALMPMILIPIVSTMIVGFVFIYGIGAPIGALSAYLYALLDSLNGGSLVLLGLIMGLMQGFDMGGPLGKTVLMFSIACMAEGNYTIMGAQAVAIPVAPLGMWIATMLDRTGDVFSKEEKSSGTAALVMGFCGVSEGAIPFAGSDPAIVIPANMIGSAIAAIMGLLFSVNVHIAWGGPLDIVLGLTDKPLLATLCIVSGSLVTGALTYGLKSHYKKKTYM